MPQELKPCPYCGSATRMVHEEAGDTAFYFVGCSDCGMYGPTEAITFQDAIAAWNALPRTPDPLTKPNMTTPEDWLTAVETAARGDMSGDPEATKHLDALGPADVILRLVEMVRDLTKQHKIKE